MRPFVISTLLLPLLIYCANGNAIDTSADIRVSATVNVSSCQINNGHTINVEFGSVVVNQLDKSSVIVSIPITCSTSGAVFLEMVSAQSAGDKTIQTSISGLGVLLSGTAGKMKNTPIVSQTQYDVENDLGLSSKNGIINLEASLKTDGTTAITGGDFKASAWLILGYS